MKSFDIYYAIKDGKYECKTIRPDEKPKAFLYRFKNGQLYKYEGYLYQGEINYYNGRVLFCYERDGRFQKRFHVSDHESRLCYDCVWLSVPADNVAIDIFIESEKAAKDCILEYLKRYEKSIALLESLKKEE